MPAIILNQPEIRISNLVEIREIRISNIEEIIRLSRFSLRKLRRLNREQDRLYTGPELTKAELIFQLTFKRDAPVYKYTKSIKVDPKTSVFNMPDPSLSRKGNIDRLVNDNIMTDEHFHNQYE